MSRDRQQDLEFQALDPASLRKIGAFMLPYKWLFVRLAVIMLFFAFLDAAIPLLTRTAIDEFAVPRRTEGLVWFGSICALFAIGRGLAVWLMIVTGGTVYARISCDLRRQCYNHLQTLSFSYFDRHAVGWIMSRLTSDVRQLVRLFAWGIVDIVDGVGKMLLMSVIMFWLDVPLALVVFAVLPPMLFVIWRFQAISLRRYRGVRQATSEMTAAFNEGIAGARTTKALAREEAALEEFSDLTSGVRDTSVSAVYASGLYLPLVLTVSSIGTAAALWVGGEGIMSGRVSYGTLVAFLAYTVSFFEPMKELARRFPMLQNAQAAAERIFHLLSTEPEIQEQADAQPPAEDRFSGDLRFEHVSFSYTAKEQVLKDLTLCLNPGETVALVGDTGAGKTTIVNLICRFYEPDSGVIRFDGVDYRQLPLPWLRRQIGIVQQTPHLFSGTIADNIRYGRLDATDEDVEKAARLARADEMIRRFEGGYAFRVGEEGENLSTGQKQLICLARIFLADPPMLILDEATSSVDAETEQYIQEGIDAVLAGRSSVIIAHRLSTIRRADRILVIRQGEIVEQGTHRDLLRKGGLYHSLYASQFVEEHEVKLLQEDEARQTGDRSEEDS